MSEEKLKFDFGDAIPPLKFDVVVVEPSGDAEDPLADNLYIGIKVAQPGGKIISFRIDGELTDETREELALLASEHIACHVQAAIQAAMGDKEAQALIDAGDFRTMAEPFVGDDIARFGSVHS